MGSEGLLRKYNRYAEWLKFSHVMSNLKQITPFRVICFWSNPMDTKGAIESVSINMVSVLSTGRLNVAKM